MTNNIPSQNFLQYPSTFQLPKRLSLSPNALTLQFLFLFFFFFWFLVSL